MSILEGKEKAWRESAPTSAVNIETISELQLLSLIRSEKYTEVVNTLLIEKQALWEQERQVQWTK